MSLPPGVAEIDRNVPHDRVEIAHRHLRRVSQLQMWRPASNGLLDRKALRECTEPRTGSSPEVHDQREGARLTKTSVERSDDAEKLAYITNERGQLETDAGRLSHREPIGAMRETELNDTRAIYRKVAVDLVVCSATILLNDQTTSHGARPVASRKESWEIRERWIPLPSHGLKPSPDLIRTRIHDRCPRRIGNRENNGERPGLCSYRLPLGIWRTEPHRPWIEGEVRVA